MSQVENNAVANIEQSKPWWRYPIVWMVFGGPAAVVVASLFTASLAIKHVDPVLDTSVGQVRAPSEAPAIQARNHSAEQSRESVDR
ncbi:hypothetical protein JY96_20600 [Aquabacterium sp. NJ1]|uniref:hypothetical protein n=1 Tax=Aquabacterium sp. NJ1 TaxID=1538295 RepID=UPI00052BBE6D|nr:hypothetical protein [Aquabacterium sp. NJ1]KGM41653.1 hypothetical protein JY96_20600 [Aquabacterium sp. NJ1]